ncbi:MAG: putative lipid II flippase FtsW [Oscillospiraceae bacterium]|nr:putative lipid II flippase FtsW [Oscillospiraceae bacterium]
MPEEKRGSLDLPLLLLVIVLLTVGVIMVLSASFARAYYEGNNPTYIFTRQLIFAVSGVGIMIAVSRVRVNVFRRWSMVLLFASVIMLALVLIIGIVGGGSRRWINLGFTTFQPSEVAKIAVILAYATMICKTPKKKMKQFRYGILPFAAVAGVIVGLLVLEPHLSASIIIIGITGIMIIAGGANLKWIGGAVLAVSALLALAILILPYAQDRVTAWLHPENDPLDSGFQVLQSLYAIGSGGLLGVGLGQSRQKYMYLPEEHNDYIFPIICEELGFIGAMLILMLFALLVIRCFWIALHAKTKYGSLISTGIGGLLAMQVFLNVAVVTNLIPSTGISLPFFSYGGTALWIQMIEMGIVLSVSRDIPLKAEDEK